MASKNKSSSDRARSRARSRAELRAELGLETLDYETCFFDLFEELFQGARPPGGQRLEPRVTQAGPGRRTEPGDGGHDADST